MNTKTKSSLTPLGEKVLIGVAIFIAYLGIHFVDSFTFGRIYSQPLQLCPTAKQIDLMVKNLHNANPKGYEVIRALNIINAFGGSITVINKESNKIAVTWKCATK